jgi:hypothetical protein
MVDSGETYDPGGGWIVTSYEDSRTCEANIPRAVGFTLQEEGVNGYARVTVWLVVGGVSGGLRLASS